MVKNEALATLNNVLQNYLFGLAASHFAEQIATPLQAVVLKVGAPAGTFQVNVNDLGRALKSPGQQRAIREEFEAALMRMLVGEAFEVALWYGEESTQKGLITAAPWYQFARLVRNAVSHKQAGILNMWPPDLRGRVVEWRGKMLDASMVGKPVDLSHPEALQLFQDISDYVGDKLE